MIQKIFQFIFFKLLGWRQLGEIPYDLDKYIFVAVPHTSNWDFVYGWMAIKALGLNVTIFAKDVFFVWPIGYIARMFGVAPVNRRERTNFVDSVARQFAESDKLAVLITPEGTRKFSPVIKSGYYYIAKKANIPIVVAGPDFANKSFTVLRAREPMATFEEDAADLIRFSKTMTACRPENTFRD